MTWGTLSETRVTYVNRQLKRLNSQAAAIPRAAYVTE